jgi:CPA2 family monovalent cation:H+ antiporter-2
LPLRDAFAVLFFTSVGMLFDPMFIKYHPWLVLGALSIVMIGKPLAAIVIVALVGYPPRTAITAALALAQIGEFSFILSDVGRKSGLLNETGHNVLVTCALVSITLNPILFRQLDRVETILKRSPAMWRFLTRRNTRRETVVNDRAGDLLERSDAPLAVIVGYGPVGRTVDSLLRKGNLETVIVDMNVDTVERLTRDGHAAIYGDAFNIEVMHRALPRATHLIITLPHSANRNPLIAAAKLINPEIKVFVRARYIRERPELMQVGADEACYEEIEASVALTKLVLADRGATEDQIRRESARVRQELSAVR